MQNYFEYYNNVAISAPGTTAQNDVAGYLKQVLGINYADTCIRCKTYRKIEISFSYAVMLPCSIIYKN